MQNDNFKISSYIASPISMVIFLVLCFVFAYAGAPFLSGYLFFMFLLSVASFLWGRFSEKGIEVNLKAESYHAYPEQEMEMQFTLENNKALPLVWLEWIQEYPKNNCLGIPDNFEVCDISNPNAEEIIDPVLCRRFSFIRWYETIEWTSIFQAKRRGVYLPKTIDIRTGDGFGLSVRKKQCQLSSPPVFFIYPKKISVSTDIFFKNAWSASTGPYGTIEDVTVLKGTREYLQNDSFKRINWRLAARSDDLSVNIYETIAPRSVYFFVDTASFCGVSPDNEEFEETLSVVASLIEELCVMGMTVGLYLPVSAEGEGNLEGNTLSDCLLALAYADCEQADAHFSQESLLNLQSNQSGNIYYICYDGNASQCENVFTNVGISQYSIIAHGLLEPEDSEKRLSDVPMHLISDFKKV